MNTMVCQKKVREGLKRNVRHLNNLYKKMYRGHLLLRIFFYAGTDELTLLCTKFCTRGLRRV